MNGVIDAEARVDSFEGFSVGLAVGPGTLTVAIDENGDSDIFGDRSLTVTCGSHNTGYGLNFAGDVGVDLSFTYATGSASADTTDCTGDNSSNTANASTMGLGIGVPIGDMSLAIDYENTAWDSTAASVETKDTKAGYEISFTMPVGDATAGVNISSQENVTSSGGSDTAKTVISGTEAWYTVPIGPVSLSVGYGATSTDTGTTTVVTDTLQEIGAEMSMSF